MKNKSTTLKFYSTLLKLSIALDQQQCVLFKIGEAYWGFCSHLRDFIPNADRVVLTLVVKDERSVDEWYKYLVENLIECLQIPAHNESFGIYNSFYRDPDGYSLEIQSFDIGKCPN